MKKYFLIIVIFVVISLLGFSIIPKNPFYNINWSIMSALIIGLAMLAFFWNFEKQGVSSKEVALIATMTTLAAVSRVPFAIIMSFQPMTFIVMITGYVFGVQTGFMVGALAALVSNFFLGQGPWTPWQMFCWGMAGVISALLGNKKKEFAFTKFIILAACWGFIHGWTMNLWHWVSFVFPLTLKTFLATYIASFPFDTLHSLGNVIFSLLFGKTFYTILQRFKNKIIVVPLDNNADIV
ncbi:MAG: energy-coupling factor transport system substrate-specific component [Clostridia bacterium]|jgi:energy-coupling factor transport system substrate-specific component|nr:energy-coupling factor transport system substrate-specific component [Clostridia bacterium]MDN5322994.1 energy-coupling factor transport system substrate-specific component [Clostridia bacterium]